ncbi:MAG: RdgB/HAM1 family non-canonical purine NTP pyrophosphatase [Bacteroidetes bacterium]|nr:RdgB/HAM1 family non-canonical purine NTP pyrophosphatase [Bacteroidota bacterium]MBI3481933.1 RdgB/HAM1 family non-canonical purine NTP pyrophosphatase [Bacteroidota bacterium]
MELCFATNNQHKLDEVRAIIGGKISIVSLKEIGCNEELAETTGTIAGNSRQKAEFVFKNYGINCFADDSGLEVDSLNGAPGVDSAIYAGPQRSHYDNIKVLLKNLEGIFNRNSRFVTVITLFLNGEVFQFEGEVTGKILYEKKGTEGFGYDPIFMPDGFSKTLAQMSMEEKNKISHRARAIEKLVKFINSKFE